MKQIKQLDRQALEKRIVRVSTTKDALRNVTPLVTSVPADNRKIMIKRAEKNV